MHISVWSKQTLSVATDGMDAIANAQMTTVMGGIVIDLVSAPIEPGTYDIHLNAVMGGIQIFLPAYAEVQFNGEALFGGNQAYRGEAFWKELREALTDPRLSLPTSIPEWATASHDDYPVTLRITINSVMGGARIYQLEPASSATKRHG